MCAGLEVWISLLRVDHSAKCATTTLPFEHLFLKHFLFSKLWNSIFFGSHGPKFIAALSNRAHKLCLRLPLLLLFPFLVSARWDSKNSRKQNLAATQRIVSTHQILGIFWFAFTKRVYFCFCFSKQRRIIRRHRPLLLKLDKQPRNDGSLHPMRLMYCTPPPPSLCLIHCK